MVCEKTSAVSGSNKPQMVIAAVGSAVGVYVGVVVGTAVGVVVGSFVVSAAKLSSASAAIKASSICEGNGAFVSAPLPHDEKIKIKLKKQKIFFIFHSPF
jgi:hypothetical protein